MREDLFKDLLPNHGEPIDPVAMARKDLIKALPKRFYRTAAAEWRDGAFVLCLDGKPARTPGRNAVALPTQAAGDVVAAEWAAQVDVVNPATMPITRMVNSALDGVAREIEAVQGEIVKYAGSDLLCYRAGEPQALVAAQAHAWEPILDRARGELGADFVVTTGVIFVNQPESAIAAVHRAVAQVSMPLPLAALHVMTTLTGSTLIALAVARGWLSVEAAWAAAHVDEDFQIRGWGDDDEAQARRARRWTEMSAAARLYALTA